MQCFRHFIPNDRTLERTKQSCKRRNKGSEPNYGSNLLQQGSSHNHSALMNTICLHPCSSANANISRHKGCLFPNLRRLSCFSSSRTREGYFFLFSASRTHEPTNIWRSLINRTKTTNSITNKTRVQCIDINE